jgi:uncharacterized membrane protein
MSKQRTQKRKLEVTSAEAGSEVTRRGEEITHEFDDSPLPSADELLKLQSIDPSIVPWLMERHKVEQDFRHEAHRTQQQILAGVLQNDSNVSWYALHWAGFILLTVIGCSTYLFVIGQTVYGGLLGAAVIVSVAKLFISRSNGTLRSNQSKEQAAVTKRTS